jgi:hexosaminidase
MKNLFAILLIFTFSAVYGQKPALNLIPQPVDLQQTAGNFSLTATSTVSFNSPEALKIAEMFVQKINPATGFALKARQGMNGSLRFNLNKSKVDRLGNEGYTLTVTPANIIIEANQPAGLFYGMQTLLQLLPKEIESSNISKVTWNVPGVKITDYPRFGWRGLMLDVSRNFFTKEEVEKYIEEMARFKFNTFHWHLSDDNGWRVEIKSLPKLTEVGAWRVPRGGHFGDREAPKPGEAATAGGFYTQADIKEVVQYAKERFVTILPEIDVPGHSMAAIASYPELCCTKNTEIKVNPGSNFAEWHNDGTFTMMIDNTLNPSDEKVYEFLDKVFTEIAAIFPGQYIHVGGDECFKGFWKNDPGCQALMKKLNADDVEKLQGYFMNRVEKILQSKGKKLIGWDEILDGGISPGATVMSWRGIKGGIEAAKMGHDVVMTPTTFAYIDYQQGEPTIEPPLYAGLRLMKCYSFNPVPEGVDAKYILGGQGNLWTEQIVTPAHVQYMTWPRGWALAEDFWTPDEKKNWPDFVQRVEAQFDRNDMAGINYSRAIYDPVISADVKDGKTIVTLVSEVPGLDLFYTVDDAIPGRYSPKYSKPFELPVGGPVTLRVMSYRNGKPMGHLITLSPEELKKR